MDNGNGNGGDNPYAVHPVIPMPPPVSPEELVRIQAQATESVRLQDELNVALQSIQDITAEKDAIGNDKADTQCLLQETRLSLQTQTRENASLVQQQEELNQFLQVLAIERDDAVQEKDNGSRIIAETRELLQAQIQRNAELTQQLDNLTLERDSETARRNSLEAQLGPLREQVKELHGRLECIPKLQQSLTRTHLELKQVPVLQEQVKQSANQIKSLELTLSTKEQEKKRLFNDLDAKRHLDVETAKNACQVEAEKQLEDALNKKHQDFGEQLLQSLQSLRFSSEELTAQFSQACSEKFVQGCCLNDLFGLLQELLDYIHANYDEQVASLEQKLLTKAIKTQDFEKMNQSLSTKLNNLKRSATHLKATSDTLQVKLDAALQHLVEKDNQVESLLSNANELEKDLAEKTQSYEGTFTQLRTEVEQMRQQNQELAKQLVEKQQEFSILCKGKHDETRKLASDRQTLETQLTQANLKISDLLSKSHDLQSQVDDTNRAYNAMSLKIEDKDALIAQLQNDLNATCETNINDMEATIANHRQETEQLTISLAEKDATLTATRQQVSELQMQAQHKDATIDSFNKRVAMLETKSKSDDEEMEKLSSHYETQLTQANSRVSDLVCQLNSLSNNSVTLQGKLDVATQEYDAVTDTLAETVGLVTQLENALNGAKKSLVTMQASLKEKDDELAALKSLLDARDAMVKPHEPRVIISFLG
jgi:chromosome segregation ATPase